MPLAHLDRIQPEYRPALCFAGEALLRHFGERLQAIFLGGSGSWRIGNGALRFWKKKAEFIQSERRHRLE